MIKRIKPDRSTTKLQFPLTPALQTRLLSAFLNLNHQEAGSKEDHVYFEATCLRQLQLFYLSIS